MTLAPSSAARRAVAVPACPAPHTMMSASWVSTIWSAAISGSSPSQPAPSTSPMVLPALPVARAAAPVAEPPVAALAVGAPPVAAPSPKAPVEAGAAGLHPASAPIPPLRRAPPCRPGTRGGSGRCGRGPRRTPPGRPRDALRWNASLHPLLSFFQRAHPGTAFPPPVCFPGRSRPLASSERVGASAGTSALCPARGAASHTPRFDESVRNPPTSSW